MRSLSLLAFGLLLLPGCITSEPTAIQPADAEQADGQTAFDEVVEKFHGVLTGATAQGVSQAFPFEVPPGTTAIKARLAWSSPEANLGLVLQDPKDRVVESGFRETATTRAFATVEPPSPGRWTLRVLANRAIQEPFEAQVAVTARSADHSRIEERYQIQPLVSPSGVFLVSPVGFAEVNLILEAGQSFNYTWTSDQPVYFNIHYHDGDQTVTSVEKRGTSDTGTFVAPERQVFSPLWENEAPTPVTVHAKVDGVFREHSRTR